MPPVPTKPLASGGWQAALLERVGRDGADAHRAPAPIVIDERVVAAPPRQLGGERLGGRLAELQRPGVVGAVVELVPRLAVRAAGLATEAPHAGGPGELLLGNGETNFTGQCTEGENGAFSTWSMTVS